MIIFRESEKMILEQFQVIGLESAQALVGHDLFAQSANPASDGFGGAGRSRLASLRWRCRGDARPAHLPGGGGPAAEGHDPGDTGCGRCAYSSDNGGNCIEVADSADRHQVLVRDTKDREGPMLRFDSTAWRRFADQVKGSLVPDI